jgi:CDP-diacylglycerol--serine O-phosphatidyltransferase
MAAVFDFFDGFVARILKVQGPLGVQLDSLADMITFGLVPGLIGFQLVSFSLGPDDSHMFWLKYVPLIIPLFSALRLGKFNIDSRQTEGFLGVPTPANTLFWIGLPMVFLYEKAWYGGDFGPAEIRMELPLPWVVAALAVLFSLLMVIEVPMMSLKFKRFGWRENTWRYVLIILSSVLLISGLILYQNIFQPLPFVILLYLVFSVLNNLLNKAHEVQS